MGVPLVPDALFERYGARTVAVARSHAVFEQGSPATHFFQVARGEIKMVSVSEEGREFAQGHFTAGQSFGEPPLLAGQNYPASAIAVTDSIVWRCEREAFFALLRDEPEIHLALTRTLATRLLYKSIMLAELAVEEAEHRLATLMDYMRRASGCPPDEPFLVPYTRQELADMSGLRVETVVRSVKAMEQKGQLRIEDRKIVFLRRP